MMRVGAMETRDGRWRVEVGGVGATTWYTLIGPDVRRNLPSLGALLGTIGTQGIDIADLQEVDSRDAEHTQSMDSE